MSGKFNEIAGSEFSNKPELPEIKQEGVEDFKPDFNEISDGNDEVTETPEAHEVTETTESVENKDEYVSEINYEDGEKVSETRTHVDGTIREIDYKPEIGEKSEIITKPDGSRTETVHWGKGEVTSEDFAPDGHKTKTFENVDGRKTDTRFDENETVSRKTETIDGHRTETRFDKNGEPYVTIQNRKTELKPNNHYELRDGSVYETDDKGRITSAEKQNIEVKSEEGRKTINDPVEGKLKTDDRGHLIADRFGGINRVENLTPQDSNLNRGEMKALENKAADAALDGSEVNWKVEPQYVGDNTRPDSFKVTLTIDGETEVHTLDNQSSNEQVA